MIHKAFWILPLIIGAVAAFIFTKRKNPVRFMKVELEAIDSAVAAKKLQAKHGAAKAKRMILDEHKATLDAMDREAFWKAKDVMDSGNLAGLAKHLRRVANSS